MGNACASKEAVQGHDPVDIIDDEDEDCVDQIISYEEEEDVVDVEEEYAGQEIDFGAIESEYEDLKKRMLATGSLYKDDIFRAAPRSLCIARTAPRGYDRMTWKRTSDLRSAPSLLKDGIGHDDIVQGALGNCWWLSAVGAISTNPKFMTKIIPRGQVLSGNGYVGMVHFRFWRFGKWVDVVVDDQIPNINGHLVFAKSTDQNEFWVSLLEKAYAKLHGSYYALRGGKTGDGLTDLTGGMSIVYDLGNKTPPNFASILHKAIKNGSFVCTNIGGATEKMQANGLAAGHAYSVLGSAKVDNLKTKSKVHLVKVKNPHGGRNEWNGAYNDGSDDWKFVSEEDKKRIRFADKDNGTWWMLYSDFISNFRNTTICSTVPDFDEDGDASGDSWHLTQVHGEWKRGVSAGGSKRNIRSYATNPQYLLHLKEPDNFDPAFDDADQRGKCTAVIGLMQEHRRAGRADGHDNFHINIKLFRVNGDRENKLEERYLRSRPIGAVEPAYVDLRERTLTVDLPPGFYVMLPSTLRPNMQGTFLIRVFTEKPCSVKELS